MGTNNYSDGSSGSHLSSGSILCTAVLFMERNKSVVFFAIFAQVACAHTFKMMRAIWLPNIYSRLKRYKNLKNGYEPEFIGVANGAQGVHLHPQGDEKISRHFCWNEGKMGLNLVRCTPADEIKRYVSMTYMTM